MGLNLLIALSRRLRLMGVILFLALAAGTVLCLALKPYYTATTAILPPQQSSSAASGVLSQLGTLGAISGLGGGVLKNPVDLYGAFIQSQTVENAMVAEFDLVNLYKVKRVSEARKKLESQTTIDTKGKDGLLRLSVNDPSPERAAQLANGYIQLTIKLSQTLAVSEASQRRLFLEQQLEQVKDKLATAEEDLKRTENATGVIQIEAQGRSLIESAANLRAQIVSREAQLQSLRTFNTDQNPQVQQLRQEIAALQGQLTQLNGKGDTSLSGSKGQISSAGLEYIRKQREVKYQEAIFEILARQFEAAKIDEAHEGALLQVVDPARTPDYRSGPKRLYIVAGCLAVGFLGVVGYILLQLAWLRIENDPELAPQLVTLKQTFSSRRP